MVASILYGKSREQYQQQAGAGDSLNNNQQPLFSSHLPESATVAKVFTFAMPSQELQDSASLVVARYLKANHFNEVCHPIVLFSYSTDILLKFTSTCSHTKPSSTRLDYPVKRELPRKEI
jgi:hypothetical protein